MHIPLAAAGLTYLTSTAAAAAAAIPTTDAAFPASTGGDA